ncbi:MAG: hypothetical protein KAS32_10840 [Candidatus Peribacteraceae bacterium]|nr:hypothetical protein [Candidatus Peribacteraceae bacterium]
MADTSKTSLRNVGIIFTVVFMCATVVGAAFITYDNTKQSKKDVALLESRMQDVETRQARFEGIMDERTRNTAKRVDDIYSIVKEWEPN